MIVVITDLPPPIGRPVALSSWEGVWSGATSLAKVGMQASAQVAITTAGNKHLFIGDLLETSPWHIHVFASGSCRFKTFSEKRNRYC